MWAKLPNFARKTVATNVGRGLMGQMLNLGVIQGSQTKREVNGHFSLYGENAVGYITINQQEGIFQSYNRILWPILLRNQDLK